MEERRGMTDEYQEEEERALEAQRHGADRTFINPEDLLLLLHTYRLASWEARRGATMLALRTA